MCMIFYSESRQTFCPVEVIGGSASKACLHVKVDAKSYLKVSSYFHESTKVSRFELAVLKAH